MEYTEEECKTYMNETFWQAKPSDGASGELTNGDANPAPLTIQTVNHVSLDAGDVAKTVDFYVKVLGFKHVPRPPFKFDGAWLVGGSGVGPGGGLFLHIIEADPTVPRKQKQWQDRYTQAPEPWFIRRGKHTAFEVGDLPAAEAQLRKWGIPYDKFAVPGTDQYQCFFFDPEGNGIEIGEYGPVEQMLHDRIGDFRNTPNEQLPDSDGPLQK